MAGYRTWTPGEVITASNVQEYLQDQSVFVFPSDSVRSTAIISPNEGMLSWLEDSNKYQYYDGVGWEDLITDLTGGTAGQPYVSNGTAAASFQDASARYLSTVVTSKTANYTLQASDVNSIIQTTGTANVIITVEDVMDIGDTVSVVRNGSGSAIISAGTSVTSWAGFGTASTSQDFFIFLEYGAAGILKTGAGTYRVIGAIDNV